MYKDRGQERWYGCPAITIIGPGFGGVYQGILTLFEATQHLPTVSQLSAGSDGEFGSQEHRSHRVGYRHGTFDVRVTCPASHACIDTSESGDAMTFVRRALRPARCNNKLMVRMAVPIAIKHNRPPKVLGINMASSMAEP